LKISFNRFIIFTEGTNVGFAGPGNGWQRRRESGLSRFSAPERRMKNYQLLTKPRNEFREIEHRHKYRKNVASS